VRLVGYGPAQPLKAVAAESLPLTLTWECLDSMEKDYTVFIHLVGVGSDHPSAQADGQPLGGSYPTSFWKVGERLADAHVLDIPADIPAGEYELRAGMYLLDTGERLPLLDADGVALGDSVWLGPVTVTSL